MRRSILFDQRFDDVIRHTWRLPLPSVDQNDARLFLRQSHNPRVERSDLKNRAGHLGLSTAGRRDDS